MFKTIIKNSLLLLAGSSIAFATFAKAPTEITFTNQTPLAFDTSIAGLPGNGIGPNMTRVVGYGIIVMGCNFANALSNCPIEFRDHATGNKVATVRMNVTQGKLVEPPNFYGDYGTKFEVVGWETDPLSHITIKERA